MTTLLNILSLVSLYPFLRFATTTEEPKEQSEENDFVGGLEHDKIHITKWQARLLLIVDFLYLAILASVVIIVSPVYIPLKLYILYKGGYNGN